MPKFKSEDRIGSCLRTTFAAHKYKKDRQGEGGRKRKLLFEFYKHKKFSTTRKQLLTVLKVMSKNYWHPLTSGNLRNRSSILSYTVLYKGEKKRCTSFACVLSISCVGYYASKLIKRVGYCLSITHLSYRYKKTTNKMIIFGQT